MQPQIIYKDRHLLIIDKPAGMPSVNVAGGNPDTAVRWITENFPRQKDISEDAGLINRLDNGTSGIIVAARSENALAALKGIWGSREVTKEYTALVLGRAPAHARITALIAHHPSKSNKMIVVTDTEEAKKLKARYAETEFRLIESYFDYTLIKVTITTGIRHQIRCHLASIGHPVAGDRLYQKVKHTDRDWLGLARHFLHASLVRFPHPVGGKIVEFASPLPPDLSAALDKLK